MNGRLRNALMAALVAFGVAAVARGVTAQTPLAHDEVAVEPLATTLDAKSDAASPAKQDPQMLVIDSNTQATIDDLKLAAFNFRKETYKDDKGADKNGLTCALHVFVRDDESKNLKLRVHPGQKFTASGKSFEVVSVDDGQVTLSFR